jgi:hypothetical protein
LPFLCVSLSFDSHLIHLLCPFVPYRWLYKVSDYIEGLFVNT